MRIKRLFLLTCVILLLSITIVQAAQPYTVGMIGNISTRLLAGKANVMFVGDSKAVQDQASRPMYGAIATWKPNQWKGLASPYTAVQGSGGIEGVSDNYVANSSNRIINLLDCVCVGYTLLTMMKGGIYDIWTEK